MCGGIKSLKHNMMTTLRLAYHGCKNLTHTSKTRQVKRTQMVTTAVHDSRVCHFFRLLRIEGNETVAPKVMGFKSEPSPESLQ